MARNPAHNPDMAPLEMAPGIDRPPEGHVAAGAKHPVRLTNAPKTEAPKFSAPEMTSHSAPKSDGDPTPLVNAPNDATAVDYGDQTYPTPMISPEMREHLMPEHEADKSAGGGAAGIAGAASLLAPQYSPPQSGGDMPLFEQFQPNPAFPTPMMPIDMAVVQTFWYA